MSRALAVALAALLPGIAAAQGATTHPLNGSKVAIYNIAGEVVIRGGSGSAVTVEVTPNGKDARQLKVETGEIRGIETLRVIYPEDRIIWRTGRHNNFNSQFSIREDGTWGDYDGSWRKRDGGRRITVRSDGDGLEASANLQITIPAGKRVAVFLGVGKVDVSNVDGDLTIDVASANIVSRETKGLLNLDTGSGNVEVSSAEGELDIDTGSGEVTITGSRGGRLRVDTGSGTVVATTVDATEVDIDTGSGDIRLEGATTPRLMLDTGSGSVNVVLRTAPEAVEIETGSGDVTLRLPASTSASVDLDTGSGDLTVDFPLQLIKKSDSSLLGKIGDGRGRIAIETGSGNISLVK